MSRVRILYWKEIPIQVQAEDDTEKVSIQLDDRFQKSADRVAMIDGSHGTDEYLEAWEFGSYTEMDCEAAEAAELVAAKLEQIPNDFASRILQNYKVCFRLK